MSITGRRRRQVLHRLTNCADQVLLHDRGSISIRRTAAERGITRPPAAA